jgi:hypothetical protein
MSRANNPSASLALGRNPFTQCQGEPQTRSRSIKTNKMRVHLQGVGQKLSRTLDAGKLVKAAVTSARRRRRGNGRIVHGIVPEAGKLDAVVAELR